MNNYANIMTIQDLLRGKHHGFDTTGTDKIKMVRLISDRKKEIKIGGKPQKMELRDIYKYHRDQFEEYFKEEEKERFKDTKYVVVFLAEDGWDSRLVGVYVNLGKDLAKSKKLDLNYYNLEMLHEFEFLNDRVIVDWGKGTNQFHGWNVEKYVTRIEGYVDKQTPRFDSYENVMLKYSDLKAIIDGDDDVWRKNLQSVNCIYCIVDKFKGKLYIGSTYNKTAGIWERWKEYATSIDGFAEELKKLIVADPNYVYNFQWIILEVLPLKVSPEKAIGRESFYKEKFCTREHGYNLD